MDVWIDGSIDVSMERSMYRLMDKSMDGWMNEEIYCGKFYKEYTDQSMGSVVRGGGGRVSG